MGLFSNIYDAIKINNLKGKTIDIKQLSRLNDNQLKRLADLNGGSIILGTAMGPLVLEYDPLKKLIELYQYSNVEYEDIIKLCGDIDINVFKQVLSNESVNEIKNSLYRHHISQLIKNQTGIISLDTYSEEFIENNNDIFLVNILPDEIRQRFYTRTLTDTDILNNIELFSSIDFFKEHEIKNFINSDNSYFRELISKVGLNDLKKILDEYNEKFYQFYVKQGDIKNVNDFKSFVDRIYTDEEFIIDLFGRNVDASDGFFKGAYIDLISLLKKPYFIKLFRENFSSEFGIKDCIDTLELLNKIKPSDKIELDQNEINQIIEELLRKIPLIIDIKKEKFSPQFVQTHQNYFLPDNAPEELKNKFYSRQLTFNDVKENLSYFSNTNIQIGMNILPRLNFMFSNSALMKILELCGGTLEPLIENKNSFWYEYIIRNQENIDSYEDFIDRMENFYSSNIIGFKELEVLRLIGFNKSLLDKISLNIEKSGIPQTQLYDLDIRLFSDNIVENFGFDVIKTILEYRNSGVNEKFYECAKDTRLREWFIYLNKNNVLDKKMLVYAVLSFYECNELINDLLNKNAVLNNQQISNLRNVLINKNKYNVTSIDELTNYVTHKKNILNQKFDSDEIGDVKDSILEILFGMDMSLYRKICYKYNLEKANFYKKYIASSTVMSTDIKSAIEIFHEISSDDDIDHLRERFKEIIKIGNIGININEIEAQLTRTYTEIWNQQLFTYEKIEINEVSFVDGVDSIECPNNILGNKISSKDKIKVIELNEQHFGFIVHNLAGTNNPDKSMTAVAEELLKKPSVWETAFGSTTLSTSYITHTHLETFDRGTVYYGFDKLPSEALASMFGEDANTKHGGGQLQTGAYGNFIVPEKLMFESINNKYNEVVLRRDTGIRPSFIVCFDGKINEQSKLAAQYFNVPIYMIDRLKYKEINKMNAIKYKSGNITKFDSDDMKTILLMPEIGTPKERIELCLNLCEKALNTNLINLTEYYDKIYYLKNFLNEIGSNWLNKKIDEILNNQSEVIENGYGR